MKATLISIAIRLLMGAIALGVGIWYLSSSISGAAITYTSLDGFLGAIGAGNDIASANGCFLCQYITELFAVIGRAAEMFWTAMVDNIWILMAIGFGLFVVIYTAQYLFDAAKKHRHWMGQKKNWNSGDGSTKSGARVHACWLSGH